LHFYFLPLITIVNVYLILAAHLIRPFLSEKRRKKEEKCFVYIFTTHDTRARAHTERERERERERILKKKHLACVFKSFNKFKLKIVFLKYKQFCHSSIIVDLVSYC